MDYRTILATGFLLLCGAVFVQSLNSANAFPQGPNVSMGSNPIESWAGRISGTTQTLLTTTSSPFIISDIILTMTNHNCVSTVTLKNSAGDDVGSFKMRGWVDPYSNDAAHTPQVIQHAFTSGIRINSSDQLDISESGNCSAHYNISGYYTH